MGAGATAGVTAAVQEASQDDLVKLLAELPAADRAKLKHVLATPRVRSLAPEKLESASDILKAIREKAISCVDVVEKCLKRIEATNGQLAACPEVLADEARAKAQAVDEKIARGEALGPLEGLPLVVKINVDVVGSLSTASNPVLDGWRPGSSAPIAQALLDAGAIVVAKTNMPLMARMPESVSPMYGTCRNPLNMSHSPAGSSSGTAAAIAAGMVSCGIGSDTGGSCRIPAVCCGIVGFRPSPGRYSIAGIVPCVGPADTAGPLATSVCDIMLLDSVITGTSHEMVDGPGAIAALKGTRMASPADWVVEGQIENQTNKVSWGAAVAALSEKGVDFVKDEMGGDVLGKHAFVNILKSSWGALEDYLELHRKSGAKHAGVELSTKEFVDKTGHGEEKHFRPPAEDAEEAAAAEEAGKAASQAAEEAVAAYFAKSGAKFLLTPGMGGLPFNIDAAEYGSDGTVTGRTFLSGEGVAKEVGPADNFRIVLQYALRFAGILTSIAIPTPIRCQATGLPTGVILWAQSGSDQELLQAARGVEEAMSTIDAAAHAVSY